MIAEAPALVLEEVSPVTKRKKRLTRPIAGFDGEGLEIAGKHRYTLLTTVQGFGAYETYSIRNWRHGLSTERCLLFLLGLPWAGQYRPINVSYSFGYDVTMIVTDLADSEKMALFKSGWVVWRGPKSGKLFYIEYAPRHWFFVGEIGPDEVQYTARPADDVYSWTRRHPGRKWLRIDDTFGFSQTSFVTMLRDNKLCSEEMIDYISREKAARATFTKDERTEIERYNVAECALLVKYIRRLQAMCLGLDMKLPGWYGPGAMASVLLQKFHGKHYIADPQDEAMRHFALGAASGGRIEEFMVGLLPAVHNSDINSAYPHKATMLPDLVQGEWAWRTAYTHEAYSLWEVDWRIPIKRANLMPFAYRDRHGRIWYPAQGRAIVHQCELERALTRYNDCIRIRRGLAYTPFVVSSCVEPDAYPFSWIRELAAQRLAYKTAGDMRHIPLKLGMNSIPGKFWQHPIHKDVEPPFQSFYAAGFVTAQTRAQVWDYIYSGGADASDVALIATDGVYSLESRPDVPRGKGLGDWDEVQTFHDFLLLRAGVYVVHPGTNTVMLRRSRGFGRVHLDYQTALAEWDRAAISGQLVYTERRFMGLGSCAGRSNYCEYGQWTTQERIASYAPQKGLDNPAGSDVFYLHPPSFARDALGLPYSPRPPQDDSAAFTIWQEIQQELTQLGDQP